MDDLGERIHSIDASVQTSVLGQEAVIRECVACVLAGGHALLEGPPGVAKTLLVKSIAAATGLSFSRIQFTPDLLPADVTGTDVIVEMDPAATSSSVRGRSSATSSWPMRSIARRLERSPR